VTYDGELPQASSSMSVTLQLDEEIDLSRATCSFRSTISRKFRGNFMPRSSVHGTSLELGRTYLVKHTARQTKIRALRIRHRVNVNTLAHEPATRLEMKKSFR